MDIGDNTHRLLKLDQVWLVLQDAKGRLQYQLDLLFCKRTFSEQKIFDKLPVRKFADFVWPNLIISEAPVHEYGAFFVGKNSVVFFIGQQRHLIAANDLFLVFVEVSHGWVTQEAFGYFFFVLVKFLHRVWRRLESFTHFFNHDESIFL